MNADSIIKRIKDGGRSGAYLRAAVRSQYTGCDFGHSLNGFVNLDVEGRQLFLEILQYKTTKGWSDDVLSDILAETENKAVK